jgi:riboflavin synthase
VATLLSVFTGIVEEMGTITERSGGARSRRFRLLAPLVAADLAVGDSVSVNGTCLTAVDVDAVGFSVEAIPETLERTNLGALVEGSKVNLERAMAASGRFDGHIVQGHVDGVGVVSGVEFEEMGRRISVQLPGTLARYVVEKGSITLNGVSLTVARLSGDVVEVALIPHTLDVTTLGLVEVGSTVNIEVDILAKYVERLMESRS